MGRRLVISDIHGAYKALKQVFDLASVDYENDKLICIGDVFDCWPEIERCFDELFKFKNLVYIIGNHDEWAREYFSTGVEPYGWWRQGGKTTIEEFEDRIPTDILFFLNNAPAYHIENNMVFVHGGFDPSFSIEKQKRDKLIWNRDLVYLANRRAVSRRNKLTTYDKIFVGHTPTLLYNQTTPIINCELHMIDTGAGHSGPLTLVDVDTDEYWQSDPVERLYKGRARA